MGKSIDWGRFALSAHRDASTNILNGADREPGIRLEGQGSRPWHMDGWMEKWRSASTMNPKTDACRPTEPLISTQQEGAIRIGSSR